MHIGSGGEKERGRRRVSTRKSGSPESSRRGRRSEERKSDGAMVLGGRRTERMKTGKWRRSRASRDDSVGVEVEGVTVDLPARSSRPPAAGVAGGRDDGARRQELRT